MCRLVSHAGICSSFFFFLNRRCSVVVRTAAEVARSAREKIALNCIFLLCTGLVGRWDIWMR